MTESFASKVASWKHQAPVAPITIGNVTLLYQWGLEKKGGCWVCYNAPFNFEGSDESKYFNKLIKQNRITSKELCFIDEVLRAMETNPYKETV
jgi:hypothetical protein